jgi:hypothetical protein
MRLLRTVAAVLALAFALPASAEAAAIDDFNTPGTLAFSTQPSLSNAGFGTQPGEPAPDMACPAMFRTGWWRIAGTGQRFTVTTAGSNFNTVLAAYRDTGGSPGTRVACDDDESMGVQTSKIEFNTQRGQSYLVQVGNRTNTAGVIVLSARAPRPANDDRAAALAVPANESRSVDSTGASSEPGEPLECGDDHYGATVWFRFSAPAIGDAVFSASGNFSSPAPRPGDTVMSVQRASDGAVLGCDDDADASGGSRLALRVAPGDYLVQVGGHSFGADLAGEGLVNLGVEYAEDLDLDRDGSPRPGDCDDGDPARHPGVPDRPDDGIDQDCAGGDAVDLDRDRDLYPRPKDCDDGNPAINPGAVDIPGDRSDQDCAGGDAPYPVLLSGITGFFDVFEKWTKMSDFRVRRVAAGTKVTIKCTGRGCPFRRRTRTVERVKAELSLLRLVRGAKLRRGARLRVKVTKPLTVGLVTTWKMRSPKTPRRKDRCLWPGKRRPGKCPGQS